MLLPELLGPFGNYQAIIYGLLLFFIIRFLPDGIAGFLRQIINRIG
jgi:ABC-type branched-subunit amino acid transport system permease subunit